MRLYIEVEDFAKVKCAHVSINKYTVLVGPNNSGKTYLMQLIQGLSSKICGLLEEDFFELLLSDKEKDLWIISDDNLDSVIEYINDKLDRYKEKIVREIFGTAISIGKLRIDIDLEHEEYAICILNNSNEYEKLSDIIDFNGKSVKGLDDESKLEGKKIGYACVRKNGSLLFKPFSLTIRYDNKNSFIMLNSLMTGIINIRSLYMPASRTGLLLLYKEFFANKTDDFLRLTIDSDDVDSPDVFSGITRPMYDYLRFLQTYKENPMVQTRYKSEIDFLKRT